MIYGFEFSIHKGTAGSKPCLWPKTDTECQVWAQHFKINIFETRLGTSANVNKKLFITFF